MEGCRQIARSQLVFAEAVVSEAKVDPRFEKFRVESQHFLELFCGTSEFPPP
jgi:hypothetical protein